MIGRKIPGTGTSKPFNYDEVYNFDYVWNEYQSREFKKSVRVERQKRRARRNRTKRNGWMFGRKIRVGTQLYQVKDIDMDPPPEPEIHYIRDQHGVEHRLRVHSCSYPRPKPKVEKLPEPGYDDVFKFFGDIADYDRSEVVFTFGNEPGSIPINAKLSFIPPPPPPPPKGSDVSKVGKTKHSPARRLHEFDSLPQRSLVVCGL